jgi:ABC-type xylose transport system substrate-binding protein
VPGHAGITGNEETDKEAKRALKESIPNDKKYPPKDLSRCIKMEIADSRQRRWEERENAMKERKKKTGWQNDTEKLRRRDQVAGNHIENWLQ